MTCDKFMYHFLLPIKEKNKNIFLSKRNDGQIVDYKTVEKQTKPSCN